MDGIISHSRKEVEMVYVSQYSVYPDCGFVITEYESNGTMRLDIKSLDEGPIVTCSVNIRNSPCLEDQIIVKDYSENRGTYDWLEYSGFIKRKIGMVRVGDYAVCPHVLLNMEKINQHLLEGGTR